MNNTQKFSILVTTPALPVLADWIAHENEAGYNAGLAKFLIFLFIFTGLGIFLKGTNEQLAKDKKESEARAEKIGAMLQRSIDRNIGNGK